ncbi:MAG: methyltransferase type 11, partial [Ignavibacteria bacterium]|nr:methyltransferase type 11 [Ignavibacteria bacterium]
MALTRQEKIWDSGFGEDYNKRNDFGNSELDEVYIKDIGVRRTDMNEDFIGFLDREAKILEVGCNIGMQLVNLQEMGFKNLYGIEIQASAVETAKQKTTGINIIRGSA